MSILFVLLNGKCSKLIISQRPLISETRCLVLHFFTDVMHLIWVYTVYLNVNVIYLYLRTYRETTIPVSFSKFNKDVLLLLRKTKSPNNPSPLFSGNVPLDVPLKSSRSDGLSFGNFLWLVNVHPQFTNSIWPVTSLPARCVLPPCCEAPRP